MEGSGPFDPTDVGTLVGLLAEPDRLRVFAAVALGATTADAVAEAAGVDRRAAVVALERLAGAGVVVEGESGGLTVAVDRFKDAARAFSEQRRATEQKHDDFGEVDPDAAVVLRNFVRSGRLTQIPSSHSKRLVVLDWLAAKFEPGNIYPEEQVNLILGMFHSDVAALRRYLVDEGFMERRDRFYWRAGGTFEV